jgi:hypothetical protein
MRINDHDRPSIILKVEYYLLFLLILTVIKTSFGIGKQVGLNDGRLLQQSSPSLEGRLIWIVYDQIYGTSDLSNALSYRPDMIFRGWFKWGNLNTSYNSKSWMIQQANSSGTLFGGGGTCSALFPDEVDSSKFQRIVSRNPNNEPEYFQHTPSAGCYHGDIQDTEYLNFVLTWIYDQINAGAQSIFLDEPDGSASWYTGYGDNGIGSFKILLIDKYVTGKGWSLTDARWQSQFSIDLTLDCPDGTISTFNYRKYLQRKKLTENPYSDENLLKHEWGDPWVPVEGTHIYNRNQQVWQYLTTAIENYCTANSKNVSIANLDFLIKTHWKTWNVQDGHLIISDSYVEHWRERIDWSQQNLGREVPLVFFHDWGSDMPFFNQISLEDRILWLRIYAAELFASGGIFAWPISNSGNQYMVSRESALEDTVRFLIDWYRSNQDLYVNTESVGHSLVDIQGETDLVTTILDQSCNSRRIVHVINKKQDQNHTLVPRASLQLAIPSQSEPMHVWVTSPDDIKKDITFIFQAAENKVKVTIDHLDAYAVLVLEYISSDVPSDSKNIPNLFCLYQNYPNPFNPTTTFSFDLPSKSFVTLIIYDLIGNGVATLVSRELSAGNHSRQWNAGGLASGIYFYRIKAGSYIETKKLLLLK